MTQSNKPRELEVCPNCNAEITFKEKDGYIELWDCPNCGKINLKKEKWKKEFLIPTQLPDVHVNCNFCKNKFTDNCTDSPNPDVCPKYDEDNNISYADKIVMLVNQEFPTYFKDQYGTCGIWIKDNNIHKTFKLDSNDFKEYCIDRFFRNFGKVPKSDNVRDAIKALEALSRNTKKSHGKKKNYTTKKRKWTRRNLDRPLR